MFDADTIELISGAPALEGLELTDLPRQLTDVYAKIVAARIRLRELSEGSELPSEVTESVQTLRRLASTHEAFVSVLPQRADRAAAAFVAASAHHACLLADEVTRPEDLRFSSLGIDSVSPEVSAAVLFLIAEASADAAEIAKRIRPGGEDVVESRLLAAVSDLATGQLERILSTSLPLPEALRAGEPAEAATRSLYFLILTGVRTLARQMLEGDTPDISAEVLFERAAGLAVERIEGVSEEGYAAPISIFPGPLHLASLLLGVARDFPSAALVNVNPPSGLSGSRWLTLMKQMAKQRPYLWRNHLQAIHAGYLETGVSAVVSFPTGAGKSKLAELKIAAALLRGVKAIFLAPTIALVDQTATALGRTFPQAQVQRERPEELIFSPLEVEPLPSVTVLTPERCLAMLSFTPDLFEDVGLIIFDECHLLHPRDLDTSRRSIDAMLCLLNLNSAAPMADILLLSAMMKNASDIAGWIHSLTGRSCIPLDLKWKPTRQVRGCVVYDVDRINNLRSLLTQAKKIATTKGVPAAVKRQLTAKPLGFFCLHQTWISKARNDYSLLPLLDEEIVLSTGISKQGRWYLTPNGNKVSAAIGVATARQGLKTLIFSQTIPLCKSTSKAIDEGSEASVIQLTPDELALYKMAADEAGGAQHLYLTVSDEGALATASASHHGLLLIHERHLHEDLFRRPDGINALVATSTLAQGMNLPSEVVIIAGDSRFDQSANRMEQLEAHELLNAAGRAGRAGEASQGFVLIVPSKVMEFDNARSQINGHWNDLQAIFSQSDQCLEIEDPFAQLLDQIHLSAVDVSQSAQYLMSRLPRGSEFEEGGVDEPAKRLLARSFGAYQARLRSDADWIASRTEAALKLRNSDPSITNSWIDQVAAASGIPVSILTRLTHALAGAAASTPPTMASWRDWLIAWLRSNPSDVPLLIRPDGLEGMFGRAYKDLATPDEKGLYALTYIERLLPKWMDGATLATLETAFGTPSEHLEQCEKAREFILRIVPEMAYLYGLLPQLYVALFPTSLKAPVALALLGAAVREGFDSSEKLALRQIRARKINRVAIHREYYALVRFLDAPAAEESFPDIVTRVKAAADIYDFVNG
jgi:hypothetical protein